MRLGDKPVPCPVGIDPSRIENTLRAPRGFDMGYEVFRPGGRHVRLGGHGSSQTGTWSVCGNLLCAGDHCRWIDEGGDGTLVVDGIPLRPAPPPPPLTTSWVRTPTADELRRAYPLGADGIAGTATLACLAGDGGLLVDCDVVSEAPRDRGFGAAALRLSRRYRLGPRSTHEQHRTGAPVILEIRFAADSPGSHEGA